MHEKLNIHNLILAAIFSVMGILVPLLFHLLGLGSMFLPMYLPLAVGAFLLSVPNALIAGIFTPLLSSLITGMPPMYPPVAFMMTAQLGIFCVIISALHHRFKPPVILTLLIALTADRLVLVLCYYFIAPAFSINFGIVSAMDLLKSIPGIVLMVVLVPVAVPRCVEIIRRNSLRLFEHKKD